MENLADISEITVFLSIQNEFKQLEMWINGSFWPNCAEKKIWFQLFVSFHSGHKGLKLKNSKYNVWLVTMDYATSTFIEWKIPALSPKFLSVQLPSNYLLDVSVCTSPQLESLFIEVIYTIKHKVGANKQISESQHVSESLTRWV